MDEVIKRISRIEDIVICGNIDGYVRGVRIDCDRVLEGYELGKGMRQEIEYLILYQCMN